MWYTGAVWLYAAACSGCANSLRDSPSDLAGEVGVQQARCLDLRAGEEVPVEVERDRDGGVPI